MMLAKPTRPSKFDKAAPDKLAILVVVSALHIQYFLNGVKTCDFTRLSDDWKARVAKSKFSKMPKYCTNSRGHIGLQDHGDEVWFRNIRVKPLD